ncbi:MAG: AsnC family transcriptional regulator [Thaumarchaeota archaeon]|nr:AsnC family transcriptional regulator [Nitrososphaerota archaeon]
MPIQLDKTDIRIINALMEDGRRSYRELARQTSVSPPTIESRVEKLLKVGLIRKIVPIIDIDKLDSGNSALISIKADLPKMAKVIEQLSAMDEVTGIFATTGEGNLLLRVFVSDPKGLHEFITRRLGMEASFQVLSSQILTKTIKDEQLIRIAPGSNLRLDCEFCGGAVRGEPFTLKVGKIDRFFCCTVCKDSYSKKYGARLKI